MRLLAVILAAALTGVSIDRPVPRTVPLRGRTQTLQPYGPPDGYPVIVSSGDGGWIHLGPHIAVLLATRGFTVFGFDVKAYLASFTSGAKTLDAAQVPDDYHTLVEAIRKTNPRRPILVGVSVGAGLSVLAATGAPTRAEIDGIVCVGLPDRNELAWRWEDAITYLTHRLPNEPTFSVRAVVSSIGPIPIAAIHSTHDEYVPLAELQLTLARVPDPKRLWIVEASNHRFSDNLPEFDRSLLEAIEWIRKNGRR
jgi:fermentation-respiration switch protein FrsA (DUF1100 family)